MCLSDSWVRVCGCACGCGCGCGLGTSENSQEFDIESFSKTSEICHPKAQRQHFRLSLSSGSLWAILDGNVSSCIEVVPVKSQPATFQAGARRFFSLQSALSILDFKCPTEHLWNGIYNDVCNAQKESFPNFWVIVPDKITCCFFVHLKA